ncbi:Hexapeptide repeat of succinyl-transferase [Azospirillum oryzae]|uniref:Hexapeptide repeat of succinyl-transferase n=1 Tax=Azospirillum oryzae TaxID=286727 RepID=A0A1X7EY18_9PROT|nr:acyltransferase [Azospirillum oryzae]SMF42231.1 Hexapeptide repeat of succinyl-transferase [Azospirillum oryzae]
MTADRKPQGLESDDILAGRYPEVTFGINVQLIGMDSMRIGAGSLVGDDCWLNVCVRDGQPRLVIGEKVCVGRHSVLSTAERLEIGSFCLFAPRVYLADVDHAYERLDLPVVEQGLLSHGKLTVEENCWMGINATVIGGITVGRGSVVAANSVVLDTVPPFSVVAGSPARIVRMYDPLLKQWRKIAGSEDLRAMETIRRDHPLPDRESYLKTLRSNSRITEIIPAAAGRGMHMP